jgi:lipopolysaccharide biosynthesis glycosyltransferase
MPLATTLRSIVEANQSSWPLEFHVFSTCFSAAARAKISDSLPERSASIHWASVDLTRFAGCATHSHISKMTYARLLVPQMFRDTASMALYIDSDLLVLDDLAPIWQTDLKGAVLGAVVDEIDRHRNTGDPRFDGVPPVVNYFNAGVLLIDLKRWRDERISERSLEYLVRNPRSPYSDQDALNVACDGLWTQLDPRWNFQNHCSTRISRMSASDRPGIVHFVTGSKPWNPEVRSVNARLYNAFRNRTSFAQTPTERMRDFGLRLSAGVRNVIRRRGLLAAKI